jgi:AcrR family transcriptional regulator
MARTVKPPDVRRNEILDVAQRLFYTKGYRRTSVSDIIDEIGIAKGTFYHHFRSKQALLDALVERVLEASAEVLEPVVQDPDLPALEKMNRLFATAISFKLQQRDIALTLLEVWQSDDNALLREKTKAASLQTMRPMLGRIIRQGAAEGCFSTRYPDEIGEVVLQMGFSLSEGIVALLLAEGGAERLDTAVRKVAIYEDAITRLLGAAPGAIQVVDVEGIRPWFE